MKTIPLPPLEVLNQLLIIDESSPSGLRWKSRRNHNAKAGDVAGWLNKKLNRWQISIFKTKYFAYRIYLYMTTGKCLDGLEVDHKDFDTSDREKLRIATRSQNEINKEKIKTRAGQQPTSKYKGVNFRKDRGKWRARIQLNSCNICLGSFNSEEDAARAYNEAALKYFGEFARLNNIDG